MPRTRLRDLTEGELLDDKVDPDVIAERVDRLTRLVEELTAQRAEERIGETVTVLVEEVDEESGEVVGRAAHQGPDVDGECRLEGGSEDGLDSEADGRGGSHRV